MKRIGSISSVQRLIEMKREELDRYRQDLVRLEGLVQSAQDNFHRAKDNESLFLEETRENESVARRLNAEEMIDRRRFLNYLQESIEVEQRIFDATVMHRNQAHQQLEQAYAEVRALERLAERLMARAAAEEQRIGYLVADDLEITRSLNARGAYVSH